MIIFSGGHFLLYVWFREIYIQGFCPFFFDLSVVLFCCWVLSVIEMVIFQSQPDIGFENGIKCLPVVHGKWQNYDTLVSSFTNPCENSLKSSPETLIFSFHKSLFCSLYTPGMNTVSKARSGELRQVY